MKACRNCRQTNEDTARFCYQCGSRLAATLPVFTVPLPKQLQKSSAPIVAETVIAHPLQTEPVVTRENQGSVLNAELNEKMKQGLKERSASAALAQKPKMPTEVAEAGRQQLRRQVLNSSDKAVLRKIMTKPEAKPASPIQITRDPQPFALQKLEKLAQEKQAQVERRSREQQVQEDLAYLDQMFNQKPAPKSEPKAVHAAASDHDPKAEALARIENRREMARKAILGEETQATSAPAINASQWLKANQQRRLATPSEQLQRAGSEPGQEWMTPFLTIAVFLYFCYVLYI